MQERFIPATECRPDPTGEARNRANQKMKKGYMLVREQPSLAGVVPPPPVETSNPASETESGVSSVLKEWGQDNTQNWF
jgi:hypothetical protein